MLLLSELSVTAGPVGGRADTIAVFFIFPESISACVIVYKAKPEAVPPGAIVDGVNGKAEAPVSPSLVSVILILLNVTLPRFVAVNVYVIISPFFAPAETAAVLTNAILGSCVKDVTVGSFSLFLLLSELSDTLRSNGSFAFTIAVFVILPASISACVMVYVAEPVAVPPGAIILGVNTRLLTPILVSEILGSVNFTLPVFVAVNVYVIV